MDAACIAWLYHDLESPDIQSTRVPPKKATDKEDKKIDWVQSCAVASHPTQYQWATGGYDGKLKLWDFSGTDVGTIELPKTKHQEDVPLFDIAFSPHDDVIAALVGRRVYLWRVTAFKTRPQPEPIGALTIEGVDYCRSFAYSQNGKQLAVACNDAGVRIYDMTTLELVKTITVHKNAVSDVAFSPGGTKLATASLDKTFLGLTQNVCF